MHIGCTAVIVMAAPYLAQRRPANEKNARLEAGRCEDLRTVFFFLLFYFCMPLGGMAGLGGLVRPEPVVEPIASA